ncbi:hypothetical protein ACFLT4_03490 [Chloroflexota bacterium]
MKDEQRDGVYEVVWPRGHTVGEVKAMAKRLDNLNDVTVCELAQQEFRANEIFDAMESELAKRFTGIKFVRHDITDALHDVKEGEIIAALLDKLRGKCDAIVTGVGA